MLDLEHESFLWIVNKCFRFYIQLVSPTYCIWNSRYGKLMKLCQDWKLGISSWGNPTKLQTRLIRKWKWYEVWFWAMVKCVIEIGFDLWNLIIWVLTEFEVFCVACLCELKLYVLIDVLLMYDGWNWYLKPCLVLKISCAWSWIWAMWVCWKTGWILDENVSFLQ